MTEVCSLSSGLYEIAKMSGTTKDDSGRTLLRTWRQVKKILTGISRDYSSSPPVEVMDRS